MRAIVAADIHGVGAELRALLAPYFTDALFVSPWDGDACPYASEAQAHAQFIAARGIEPYAEKIAAAAGGQPAFIVAFSVGASAAWLYAASAAADPRSVATLFYGSRIRDYARLTPRCAVSAVFAEREASFHPAALARQIAGPRVRTCIEAGTAHGFMNPLSADFVAALCAAYLTRLAAELASWRSAFA